MNSKFDDKKHPGSPQHHRPIPSPSKPHPAAMIGRPMSHAWLAARMLQNTDSNNGNGGDICLSHYPTTHLPKLTVEEMSRAFRLVEQLGREWDTEANDGGVDNDLDANAEQELEPFCTHHYTVERYSSHSSPRIRDQINRILFAWYQFDSFPREVVARTYRNLSHVDVRQNASLTCIESIILQLPNLSSLNLSDCPNLLTLTPLAHALGRGSPASDNNESDLPHPPINRRHLNLRHLWVRGCNLSSMSRNDWSQVFDALSNSVGPLERLTLSRNQMTYLHSGIGKLESLSYLFVEDNQSMDCEGLAPRGDGFEIPMELGSLANLRFVSLCGNNIVRLPRTMGRLNTSCDVHLHRNPNLVYPPAPHAMSVKAMREYFHRERMVLFGGIVLFAPYVKNARFRANERLYRPGGMGYLICKDRFHETVRINSMSLRQIEY